MTYKHRDLVRIPVMTEVYTEITGKTYGDMWAGPFVEDVQLANPVNIQVITKESHTAGTIMRELSDGRYVVSIPVNTPSGFFSDHNYVIADGESIVPAE